MEKSGVKVDWPLMAVVLTVIASMVTGAIQLGAVQTHVAINTVRLDQLEERERKAVITDLSAAQSIARIEEHQKLSERAVERTAIDLASRLVKIESQLDQLLKKAP